jgi:hypothetical protein
LEDDVSAPRNPYRHEAMSIGADAAGSWRDREPIPSPGRAIGLHSVDLHEMAVRNYRAGAAAAREETQARVAELEAQLVTAWDEGNAAGSSYAEERALRHVEMILRTTAAKLEPQKGVSDAQARRAATELVRGALLVLVNDEDGEPDGLDARGFAALEKVLTDAVRADDDAAHEHRLED